VASEVAHCLSSSSHSLHARWLSRCAPVLRACRPYVIFPRPFVLSQSGCPTYSQPQHRTWSHHLRSRTSSRNEVHIHNIDAAHRFRYVGSHLSSYLHAVFCPVASNQALGPIRVHDTSCFRFECNTAPSTAWCMSLSLRSDLCHAYFASSRGAWCRPEAPHIGPALRIPCVSELPIRACWLLRASLARTHFAGCTRRTRCSPAQRCTVCSGKVPSSLLSVVSGVLQCDPAVCPSPATQLLAGPI